MAEKKNNTPPVSNTGNDLINAAGVNQPQANANPGTDAKSGTPDQGAGDAGTDPIPQANNEGVNNGPGPDATTLDQNQTSANTGTNESLTQGQHATQEPAANSNTNDGSVNFQDRNQNEVANMKEAVKDVPDEQLVAMRSIIDEEMSSRNLSTTSQVNAPTQEEAEHQIQEELKAKYGENFVTATRGKETTYFSRATWNNLVADAKGTRDGWVESVPTPPEVRNLQNR